MDLTPDWAFDDVDHSAMRSALEEAEAAGARNDVPVGAVILGPDRQMLARAGNRCELDCDATAHAEILAIRAASRARESWRLDGCSLYVTLEPCAMCAAACVQSRLDCVVFATPDPKAGFAGSLGNLLDDPRLNHRVAWRAGLEQERATTLLAAFFDRLRRPGVSGPS